jgi:hypothetical protein
VLTPKPGAAVRHLLNSYRCGVSLMDVETELKA